MTIEGWLIFGFITAIILGVGIYIFVICQENDSKAGMLLTVFIAIVLIIITFGGIHWYYNNTESGKRAIVNQKSEYGGGLERTINIYTANGEIIATYSGKIDIENKDGGYLLFDYNGKRYSYYNCFVESIADID